MRTIALTQNKHARVDDADYERLAAFKWYALRARDGRFYAARTVRSRTLDGRRSRRKILMHREVLATGTPEVDHIDGDSLNNQRDNLRPATTAQNMCNVGKYRNNTSGFKGVSWHRQRSRWSAQITLHGRQMYLGLFATPELAHAAYCEAAAKYHGEFARTA